MDSGDAPHSLRAKEYVTELIEKRLESGMTAFDPKRSPEHPIRSIGIRSDPTQGPVIIGCSIPLRDQGVGVESVRYDADV